MLKIHFNDLKNFESIHKTKETVMINMYDYYGTEEDNKYFTRMVKDKTIDKTRVILINVNKNKDFFKSYEIMER